MWLLTWKFPGEGECEFVPFDTEQAALEQSAAEILDNMRAEWDLSDPNQAAEAKRINDAAKLGNWGEVIDLFNGSNTNADNNFMTWEVVELKPRDKAWLTPNMLAFDSDQDEDDEIPPTLKSNDVGYQATESGATCRKCLAWSEYAYADNIDKTHLCYQCRTFIKMFNG